MYKLLSGVQLVGMALGCVYCTLVTLDTNGWGMLLAPIPAFFALNYVGAFISEVMDAA